MSSIILAGDSSGTITLTVPVNSGTNTLTLPAETGTLLSSGATSITIAGNITGNYIFGNGSLLTGLSTSSISSGTSSVTIISSGGNIRDNVGGATIATTSSTGIGVTGNVTATSYLGSQFVQSTRNITANTTIGNINVMTAGPITINDGVIVTISTGGEWTVVLQN